MNIVKKFLIFFIVALFIALIILHPIISITVISLTIVVIWANSYLHDKENNVKNH